MVMHLASQAQLQDMGRTPKGCASAEEQVLVHLTTRNVASIPDELRDDILRVAKNNLKMGNAEWLIFDEEIFQFLFVMNAVGLNIDNRYAAFRYLQETKADERFFGRRFVVNMPRNRAGLVWPDHDLQ